MGAVHEFGRRTFFRYAALTGALVAVSRLSAGASPANAVDNAPTKRRVLTSTDAAIFTAMADRMTFAGDPAMPLFSQTHGLSVVDTALLQLPEDQRQQFHYGLLLFEWAPAVMIRRFSRFTKLPAVDQDEYVGAWAASEREICRLAFEAFKNLSMLGYYADDATWKGIHYEGPWAPKPRRVVG